MLRGGFCHFGRVLTALLDMFTGSWEKLRKMIRKEVNRRLTRINADE
jgi:hypothetical protein